MPLSLQESFRPLLGTKESDNPLRQHIARKPDSKLTLGNDISIKLRVSWDIGNLPDGPSMRDHHIAPLSYCLLEAFSFLRRDVIIKCIYQPLANNI